MYLGSLPLPELLLAEQRYATGMNVTIHTYPELPSTSFEGMEAIKQKGSLEAPTSLHARLH